MHQVNLSDELYQSIQRRAVVAGFSGVDEFVVDILSHEIDGDTPDLDYLFTPERIAQIKQSDDQIQAGHFFTTEQTDEELVKRKQQWQRQNPTAK
jgi:hypothetical protein